MIDESQLNDDELRLATSRSLPADSALDAETSAARDRFLALGSAVESAARHFDEAALINRLTATNAPSTSVPSHDRWWPLIVSGAIAAGMLLAVARLAMEHRQASGPVAVVRVPDNSAPTTTPRAPAAIAWNDSLDDEITLAAATIDQFSHTHRSFDSSLLDMNDQLQALSRELSGETL